MFTVNVLNLDHFLSWIIGSAGLPGPILELILILKGKLWEFFEFFFELPCCSNLRSDPNFEIAFLGPVIQI